VALPEEEDWVRRAQAGEREAFAPLVERYWGRLFRWLRGMLRHVPGHAQAAEDLAQEVLLKAWAALPALRSPAQFDGWLFRIARNCLTDRQRMEKPSLPLPEMAIARDPGPLAPLLVQENQRLLDEACALLPPLFRGPFLLWAQEEFSYAQIAEALEITEETARWRVFRARKFLVGALRRQLDQTKP
jgi:RNA polymerase sigma-70 factor, ECF subfamily